MDYELRQFYKELNELGGETGDQTKPPASTDLDVKQCIGPYPNDIPATPPSNQHHGQVPTSQPFPSTLPNLGTCHAREEPRPQLERPPLPLNIPFSRDSQAPYHPNNLSFESHAAPPSRFEGCHPSTFIVPHGPPPPRFNYPMSFPSNILPPQQSDNFSYSTRPELPPWHGSAAPPQSRFPPPMIPKPFSQGTGERTWQDLRHGDLSRQEDGQFGERTLPHAGNVPYEQYPCRSRDQSKRKMVLLRGVPGSGKSTLARTLLRESPDGVVLSTDDYFWQENVYAYDVTLLGDAHNWNQDRARRALDDSRPLVVIDNTNIKAWEMKPYVQMAVDRGYGVEFLEPDTWWKQDSHELEKRNTHRVPRETISKMLQRYDHDMTVNVVMNSVEPRLVRPNRPPPEAQPRTHKLKKKLHKKRNRKNGRNTTTPFKPETENLVTHRQCFLSSSLYSMPPTSRESKYIKSLGPFFIWPQVYSKGLHAIDQDHSSIRDFIKTSLDLYCSLIKLFAVQTLHIYDMKCFKLQNDSSPKNRLTFRVSENQDGKSKQKYIKYERFEDHCRETELNQKECVQIKDHSKIHVETKQTVTGRPRKICKLAPTFQHPRISLATEMPTWKNHCGDGAPSLFTETNPTLAKWNPLEDNVRRNLVTDEECKDDLTRRDASCRSKDPSVCKLGFHVDDPYPRTSECSDGHENSVVTRSYSGFPVVEQPCVRLCLPEQFAKELVELYGCPGVELAKKTPQGLIIKTIKQYMV
ncbi:hypothetical protein GDO78_000438 [Eleutherodactylus coqui]|uniref:NEDD4-binding protein 2-like 2 n=1 Tax=Eleutherodactylus coqui TaxID=57060 RepID=A0A8J6FQ13_ELECQ|nr:hypothetical protein GDO78_000438 [Eleutherodactylus coqui]